MYGYIKRTYICFIFPGEAGVSVDSVKAMQKIQRLFLLVGRSMLLDLACYLVSARVWSLRRTSLAFWSLH